MADFRMMTNRTLKALMQYPERNLFLRANFYVSETMACSDKGPKLSNHGKTRYDMMEFVIKQNNNQLSEEGAMNLLNGVSQAETPGNPTSHTQWSVVYNLSQRKATVCVNRDYKNKFTFNLK